MTTAGGSTLTVSAGDPQPAELKIDKYYPLTPPPGYPASPTPGANFLGGAVLDPGRIIANTTDPNTGTNVIFAGSGSTFGPGDLNGNLDAGPNSSFTFTTAFGGAGPFTFLPGATLGPGTGRIIIATPVTVSGDLIDPAETMEIDPGGALTGAGDLEERALLSWLGGTLSLTGAATGKDGVTIVSSGSLLASTGNGKALSTTLENESAFTQLDGAGSLALNVGTTAGSIVNDGTVELSLPSITSSAPGSSFTNTALGTIQANAPSSAPTIISAPFTNNGKLNVGSGDALTLSTTGPGSPADTLNGTLALSGDLTLMGAFTSTSGFSEQAAPGFLIDRGTLTVPTGVTDVLDGNLEVATGGVLTGAGEIINAGRLQLDVSSSTMGLGSYQQTSIGTLALAVSGMGSPAKLAVTGTAQLSGTLLLLDYTPVVGDSFVVVTAGTVEDHFDTIPDGMEETDGPTSVTVTQVQPPA